MDEGAGQVRVMTTHGAKGLEAPIVILPEMTWDNRPRVGPLLKTADGGYLWCASQKADCEASAAARLAAGERIKEEQLRLLYVGLTRARDRLILCGRVKAGCEAGKIWPLVSGRQRGSGRLWRRCELCASSAKRASDFTRYGADPLRWGVAPASATEAAALPAWLTAPPPPQAEGVRYVSPSGLGDGAKSATVSPLDSAAGLGRFRRGTLIHRLLQVLPDIEPDRRRAAAERLMAREPDLSDGQRAEMADAAFGVLDDPMFAAVFGPGSRAEVAVAGQARGLPAGMAVSGQIDRLVVEDARVLVIDFKTNRPAPDANRDCRSGLHPSDGGLCGGAARGFPG